MIGVCLSLYVNVILFNSAILVRRYKTKIEPCKFTFINSLVLSFLSQDLKPDSLFSLSCSLCHRYWCTQVWWMLLIYYT